MSGTPVVLAQLYPNYGNTVDLSATQSDNPAVIISGSDTEQPTTSILIEHGQQADISHLGFWSLAFSPNDLVYDWDMIVAASM